MYKRTVSTDPRAAAMVDALFARAFEAAAQEKAPKPTPTLREQAAEKGAKLYEVYQGYQDAGFNDEQAFQLTLALV